MIRGSLAAAMAAMALAACTHAAAPAPGAELSPQARWEAGQAARLAWNARQAGWRTTESGLQHRRVKAAPAASPKPEPGATVTIHYTGTFIDGREFDSSRTRGEPATFPLGQLIKGWQEGVPMMRVGERWLFLIPADLAYGDRSRAPIPPNSALYFDIELVAIPAP
ncbi:FKBP-type peptidyl-prolyl cis-trans isomerase [Phenylobacterium sp.]|uniref:FKBP-type peptidyl-prolyl cis-trans isomerase n=1 Tax=Phenylobacterium sp. TaxID=1871053 RepID=UPI003983D700